MSSYFVTIYEEMEPNVEFNLALVKLKASTRMNDVE